MACYKYPDFVDTGKLLARKLLSQGNHRAKLQTVTNIKILSTQGSFTPGNCCQKVIQSKAMACYKYQDLVDTGKLLTRKLLSQGHHRAKLRPVTNIKTLLTQGSFSP